MSDPMSSVEIEDVLSSIRRLVSEDLRPAAAPAAAAQPSAPVAPAGPAPRLILTPQLRVVSRPAPEPARDPAPVLAPVLAEAEDEPWIEEADWLEDPVSPIGWAAPAPAPAAAPMMTQDRMLELATRLTEGARTAESEPAPAAAIHRFTLTAASGLEDDCEPEPALEAPLFVPTAQVAPQAAAQPVLPPLTLTADLAADPAPWAQPVDSFDHAPADQEQANADPAPDLQTPTAGAQPSWADRAEAEAIADIEAEAADQHELNEAHEAEDEPWVSARAETPRQGVFVEDPDPDEIIYDEQILRDLVRDILREELAGPMGEKITRSIRKMVRAEIAQMIALRELD